MEHRIAEKKLIEPGSIESSLSPDFDRLPPENIYKEYEMEVPEELVKFCRLIESHGGRVLLVGGCVRDAIMSAEAGKGKITPKDIDVEVYGIQPKDLLSLADQQFGLEKNPTVGNKFEIIRINSRDGSFSFDLSLPRDDNKTGSGNKGFETTSHPEFSILEGARRRDLSCNSMAYDPLTKITYDPYNGKKDVLDGVLRATDPEKFVEDPVRILRIMKFAARYGWKIEKETEELCKEMLVRGSDHELIKRLRNEKNKKVIVGGTDEETKESLELMNKSAVELDDEVKERIYKEFSKLLLESEKPSVGLEFAARVGVIDRYFPWLAEMQITEQEASWHPEGDAWKHTLQVLDAAALIMHREKMNEEDGLVFMLAALSHDLGKPTKTEKKIKNGVEVITSDGHDMEGGWMSEEFINAFAPKDKVKIVRDEKDEYL
jgi:tRNA nucleotidyltransferase (CCA-adding enzyme)